MAMNYSSGQYEDAYNPRNLGNWSRPRVTKEHPSAREGYTQFIADDRGHLLPSVPRSKASPWGTYMGTWDMPLRIPPAKVNLTCRSVDAAARLTEWVNKSAALSAACNGFSPEIIGQPSTCPARITKEGAAKRGEPSSRVSEHPGSGGIMPAEEVTKDDGGVSPKIPLSRQPGCMDIRLKEGSSSDVQGFQQMEPKESRQRSSSQIPLSRQPGSMDVRLKDAVSPKSSAPSRPNSRELTAPRRTISAEAPALGRPRSLEGRSKEISTPELLASHRPGTMEAKPKVALSPEALPPSRPITKGTPTLEHKKTLLEMDGCQSGREGATKPPSCLENPSS